MTFAAEAWEPVLLGGLIPLLGAGAIFLLIWHAVRAKPEEQNQQPDEGKKKGRP